jgi:hypothetical protein
MLKKYEAQRRAMVILLACEKEGNGLSEMAEKEVISLEQCGPYQVGADNLTAASKQGGANGSGCAR